MQEPKFARRNAVRGGGQGGEGERGEDQGGRAREGGNFGAEEFQRFSRSKLLRPLPFRNLIASKIESFRASKLHSLRASKLHSLRISELQSFTA